MHVARSAVITAPLAGECDDLLTFLRGMAPSTGKRGLALPAPVAGVRCV